MENVKEVVLKCHNKILKEKGIEKESISEMTLTRENGIDSIGIVSFVIDLEDELNTDIDKHLAKIRKCKTIGDLIMLIEVLTK